MRKGVSGGQDGAIAPDGGGGTPGGTEAEHKEIGDRRLEIGEFREGDPPSLLIRCAEQLRRAQVRRSK